jgi:hypothetical protein
MVGFGVLGFGVVGFGLDLDGSNGRLVYSTNHLNLESNNTKTKEDLNISNGIKNENKN